MPVCMCVYTLETKKLQMITKYGQQIMEKNATAICHEYKLLLKSVHHISAFPKPNTNVEKVA